MEGLTLAHMTENACIREVVILFQTENPCSEVSDSMLKKYM